mgnify:CR=1 FL=1
MKKRIFYSILMLGFLLSVYEGRIAIWKDDQKSPMMVFPYSVKSLPATERLMLEEGIRFNSMDELRQMIADYLS